MSPSLCYDSLFLACGKWQTREMSEWACRLGPELPEKSNSYTPTGKDGHTGKNPMCISRREITSGSSKGLMRNTMSASRRGRL